MKVNHAFFLFLPVFQINDVAFLALSFYGLKHLDIYFRRTKPFRILFVFRPRTSPYTMSELYPSCKLSVGIDSRHGGMPKAVSAIFSGSIIVISGSDFSALQPQSSNIQPPAADRKEFVARKVRQ